MTDSELNNRIKALEDDMAKLKQVNNEKTKIEKKEKKARAPSEYNKFVKEFLELEKTKQGDKYNHKAAFGLAANAWNQQKKIPK
jgi:pyruvate/2-oxoacid:ferredoxin oxidoreductase beta subunit